MGLINELYEMLSRTSVAVMIVLILVGLVALLVGATGSLPWGNSPPIEDTVWRGTFAAIGLAITALGMWGLWLHIRVFPGT